MASKLLKLLVLLVLLGAVAWGMNRLVHPTPVSGEAGSFIK